MTPVDVSPSFVDKRSQTAPKRRNRGIFCSVSHPSPITRRVAWSLFWLVSGAFYFWLIGRASLGIYQTARLAVPLLGIAVATAMILGSWLVPRYLLTRRFGLFALYSGYIVVLSVYLVLLVIVGEFMLSDYAVDNMTPAALDRPGLLMGVYVVVATAVAIRLFEQWDVLRGVQETLTHQIRHHEDRLDETQAELREARQLLAREPQVLEIQVDRKTVRLNAADILFLESAADYVLVSTQEERLITKARLSQLVAELEPAGFLRVHRSFVVRLGAVDSFTATSLMIGETAIPVGRTYRHVVRTALEGRRPATSS